MESRLLESWGIDPAYIIILLLVIQLLLFILIISTIMKYDRLKQSYFSFMRGKDGKTLEKSILAKFDELEDLSALVKKHSADIKDIHRRMSSHYQKIGIVKYDAFLEMGGNLSFALTMLDEKDNGWILNVMRSQEGCYTYVKEIVKGESFIELSEEEAESLERAIFQETYDINVPNLPEK